jgi:hypothetical protein
MVDSQIFGKERCCVRRSQDGHLAWRVWAPDFSALLSDNYLAIV